MLPGESDLLQNNKATCQVETGFKLPGYYSGPSFPLPLAIKYRNTKAMGWTLSHLGCRCLSQPPKSDARIPCPEHRAGVCQRQVSSRALGGRGCCLCTSALSLTSERRNIPVEILKLKYYLTFWASPIALQEYFAIISVQQRAEYLCPKRLFLPLLPYIPWDTLNHPEIIQRKRRGKLLFRGILLLLRQYVYKVPKSQTALWAVHCGGEGVVN